MPASDKALLDYIASHLGAGRSAIMRDAVPEASAATLWRAPWHLMPSVINADPSLSRRDISLHMM